jgi:tRNA threonylcarbamoyl adenosine modification protein (Sua5/YciO/YrdC/YwlC family)
LAAQSFSLDFPGGTCFSWVHIVPEQIMAKFIEINPYNPQPRLIGQVVELLRRGGVICYPTDTMYGVGCDIFNQKAVKRVHQLKQRPKHKPFSFMCSSLKNISKYAHVGNTAYRLMRKNLPGPYTLVLPGSKLVPKIMLTKQKTVGIRVPDNPICLAIIEELGNPILNTSAIREEYDEPVIDGLDVDRLFGKQVDLIIDGGEVYPDPSTVISLVSDQPEILREGKGDISPFV